MVRVGDMDSEPETFDQDREGGESISMESEATELNRLLPEKEETVVVVNHSPSAPGSSSPHSSGSRDGSRRNTGPGPGPAIAMTALTNGSPHDEDVDKISSSPDPEDNASASSPRGEDQTDECTRLTSDVEEAVAGEPKSGEYKKIMDMLKEAEASADPEYEEKKRKMEFMTKFNPRHSDSGLSFVDYCCNLFACCALCIEG